MENPVHLLNLFRSNRLPVILQSEAAECGLACLAMIVNYHGHKIDLNTLRQNYPISLKGTDFHGLIKLSDRLYFSSRAIRLELDELKNLQCPTILHWDLNHFVVLKKVTSRSIIIHDPARGEHVLTFEEASKHFTGVALELTPTAAFEKKDEEKKARLSDFWQRISGIKKTLFQILLLSLLLQFFGIISPFFMQLVIDEVVVSHDFELLKILALGFFLLMLIQVGVTALRSLIIINMGTQLNIQIANNLFHHLIRLPLSYFEKRHIGDIVSRFGSMDKIKEMLTSEIISAIVDGMMIVGTLVMMFIYSPLLTMIVISGVFIYALFRFIVYLPFRQLTEEAIIAGAKEDSNFMETIRAAQSIKLFGNEAQRQSVWQNLYANVLNISIQIGKLEINYTVVNSILSGVENILVIYLAAQLVISNQLSVGMIFAFMSYKGQFTNKATSLIEQIIEFKMISLHLARLGDIVMTEVEKDINSNITPKRINGDLEIKNIRFRYSDTDPFIINNVSLKVKAGESICLIGASGCGKSTLMKVILGLLEPTEGKILVDGMEIQNFGLRNYREQVASVMQDDQLLSGSLSDNISFFDPHFKQEKIELCAKIAAIHIDIMQMPMGYSSLIGDMGTTLSGGQKQRILLARALYKNPRILFLDESTSHLDIFLEKKINLNIAKLKLTRIIIAHRPETINFAERVFLITPEGCFEQNVKSRLILNRDNQEKSKSVIESRHREIEKKKQT
ncbi:MAG: peptidase domain-containing ABC transporter [Methylococcaceae bacterium]|nr:peptidase domain-containing ABC transporter [Methylococcaceae bacterium]